MEIKIIQNNDWIGFFSSYYGSIIGGLIGGVFTYFGVRLTINSHNESRKQELKERNRPLLQIGEVLNVKYDLINIPSEKRRGRLIVTPEYKNKNEKERYEKRFNFIVIENLGSNNAINCRVLTGNTSDNGKTHNQQEIFLSNIIQKEKIFIPIDFITTSEKMCQLITVKIEYESIMGESFIIERKYEMLNGSYLVSDFYFLRESNGKYTELYKVNGTKTEWKNLSEIIII